MIVKIEATNHLKFQRKSVVLDISHFETKMQALPMVFFFSGSTMIAEAKLPAFADLNKLEEMLNNDFFEYGKATLTCSTFQTI